jgi:hypothetical protein
MRQKICFSFFLIGLAAITFSCQPVPEPEFSTEPGGPIVVRTRMLIENHASTDKEVEFNKTFLYFGVLGYINPDPQWQIDEQVFEDETYPHKIILSGNDSKEMTVKDVIELHPGLHMVSSFILKIDGENYAGWSPEYEQYSDMPSVENGLGYLVAKTDEIIESVIIHINGEEYLGMGPNSRMPLYNSKLTPLDIEEEEVWGIEGIYKVVISDEGVSFTLEKVKQGMPVIPPLSE